MKTTITADYLATLITTLANSPTAPVDWQPDTRYIEGAKVRSGSKIYMAFNTGMSSKVAPSQTSGKSVDGTITWMFAYDVPNRQALGESLYLSLGNGGPWTDEPTPDDLTETFVDGVAAVENSIALFRLVPGDISLGVPRITWATGEVIPEWPAVNSYVIVDQSVYRCLSNNGGAESTTLPTGVSLTPFELADGYIWKYLGDISISQDQKFGQTNVFPISALYVDDGSARSLVQSIAKNGGISGFNIAGQTGNFTTPAVSVIGTGTLAAARADLNPSGTVRRIVATNPGANYTLTGKPYAVVKEQGAAGSGATASAELTAGAISAVTVDAQGTGYTGGAVAIVTGDGTGAELEVVVTSGYVTSVNVVSGGTGYTTASVTIVAGTAGAVGFAVMSPIGGHGRDMTKELPVEYLMINRRLNALESMYIPEGDIRQISLLTAVRPLGGQGDTMIGPKHPAPEGKDAADLSGARALTINNVEAIAHTDDQYEEINLALRLTK
jgi:hypothetical protein